MITVPLLVDTGATGVTITPTIAQRLGISGEDTKQGRSFVADGREVPHFSADVAFVAVGPKTKKPLQINIMENSRNDDYGLLGMSFLAEFPHMIDMKSQVIKWM
jgi:clan AA aspartic protease (TIGR02281 family)